MTSNGWESCAKSATARQRCAQAISKAISVTASSSRSKKRRRLPSKRWNSWNRDRQYLLDEASLLPLARLLADVTPLTVITNFLPIMRELTEVKGIRLIALGGEYLHKYDTFTGLLCEQNVSTLRADLFLTSVTALSRGMFFHPEERIIRVKRAMMLNASRNLMLMDHTKIGKVAIHAFAPLHEFDVLITDGLIDAAVLTELRETGMRVEVAPINTDG
ncbi:MAG: DeoR/GlpR family DNA-binding transcription regulator [Anaerolineae bacterium]